MKHFLKSVGEAFKGDDGKLSLKELTQIIILFLFILIVLGYFVFPNLVPESVFYTISGLLGTSILGTNISSKFKNHQINTSKND